jgi:hypothetical protein
MERLPVDDGSLTTRASIRWNVAMKPLWIVALVVGFVQANAQQPSARLDVKSAKTGKLLNRMWETDYGSYERDHLRNQTTPSGLSFRADW